MTDEGPLSVRAAIPCGFPGCGQSAAMVELIPKGVAYAEGQKDVLNQFDLSGQGIFRLSDFLLYVNYSIDVFEYEAVVDAVRGAGDDAAAVLYGLNKEYAPFFCAQCGYSYCGKHWKLKPSFDYGFDYYSGHCPVGHRKLIDH
jgi:hypothetical protein